MELAMLKQLVSLMISLESAITTLYIYIYIYI